MREMDVGVGVYTQVTEKIRYQSSLNQEAASTMARHSVTPFSSIASPIIIDEYLLSLVKTP